jgi:hypothetical protein
MLMLLLVLVAVGAFAAYWFLLRDTGTTTTPPTTPPAATPTGGIEDAADAASGNAVTGQVAEAEAVQAQANLKTAQGEMETCAAEANGSYEGCQLSMASVTLTDASAVGYTLTAKAGDATFTVQASAEGTAQSCAPAGTGGCPQSGTW